jgi:inhibitor of growth protein 3
VQAKDAQIQELRAAIQQRDNSLQKFIKLNGSLVVNPKEEPYNKVVINNYERAQILQEEKIGLVEKAAALVSLTDEIHGPPINNIGQLDRYVKRLDVKLRDLQNDGSIPADPQMPSLLKDSPGNLVPPLSSSNTGTSTPLHPVSGNQGGGAPNLAQAAAIARITNATNVNINSRTAPIQNMQAQALLNQQRLTNAQSAAQASARSERELSAGSDSKRRRPTGNIGPLPAASSSLGRQGSVGPGTPKPSTPGSRAGSVGPRHALTVKKAKPQQPLRKAALTAKSGVNKKRRKGGSRASPSTTAEDESVASDAGTEDEEMSGVAGEGDEEESDDTKYCFCQRVSFGDMVACDNDNCQYQWFHWECVGIKEEPVGDWLCPECKKQPAQKIKRVR